MSTLSDVLNDSSLREYQVKLTDLRRQRSELITIYTANHTKVKRLDAEIATLEVGACSGNAGQSSGAFRTITKRRYAGRSC